MLINIQELKNKLMKVLKKFYVDDTTGLDFAGVNIKEDNEGDLEVRVWAEEGYNGLMELADLLNPIIEKYDEDSYFDMECPGRLIAWVRTARRVRDNWDDEDILEVEKLLTTMSKEIDHIKDIFNDMLYDASVRPIYIGDLSEISYKLSESFTQIKTCCTYITISKKFKKVKYQENLKEFEELLVEFIDQTNIPLNGFEEYIRDFIDNTESLLNKGVYQKFEDLL